MKEPEGHVPDDEFGTGCVSDGETWPCKVWRKWVKTPEYRIARLELQVESLVGARDRALKSQTELRSRVHRQEEIAKGLWPVYNDIIGKLGGQLNVSEHVDHQDFYDYGGRMIGRVAGVRELTVEYISGDGSTYRNGHLTEREFRKP